MKKSVYVLLIAVFVSFGMLLPAQAPPPPPGTPSGGGGGGGPVGAPIDGGLGILLAMGAFYAGRKLYSGREET